MAMVNVNSLLNGKDSRWLQLEVCREFQRNKCSRSDTECKFAHPPANVEVQNGRVTACYDSIKGRCNREKPPCKYFHPPQHLKDQLLINGRNHLALKNALMQQMGLTGQMLPTQMPTVASNPYLTGVPAVGSGYSPYFTAGPLVPALVGHDPGAVPSPLAPAIPQPVLQTQKLPRSDRLEVCREFQRGACKRPEAECRFAHPARAVAPHADGSVTVCMDAVKGRCGRDPCRYFHPPLHLQAHLKAQARGAGAGGGAAGVQATAVAEQSKKRPAESDLLLMDMKTVGSFYYENFAFPGGMVPFKRAAADKSGVPVYQPATTYQQLMQLQQPFVPVSCEYPAPAPPAAVSPRPPVPPSVTSSTTPPAPSPSPETVSVTKEVPQPNFNAKLVTQIPSAAAVTPLTALTYTGVALNKQSLAASRAALSVSSSVPTLTPSITPAPSTPLIYRPPPSLLPTYPPLLRAQLQSQQFQLPSQLQAQQLQNHLANQLHLSGQLPSQLSNQINNQLNGQLSSQVNSQLQSHLSAPLSNQLTGQLGGQLPIHWSTSPTLPMLPSSLMSSVPGIYQPLIYQIPPASVSTSTPSVAFNPYKKMKTT